MNDADVEQLEQKIEDLIRERDQLKHELKDSNEWRERHSRDADAYGKQSQVNWEKWRKAESKIDEMRAYIQTHSHVGNHCIACGDVFPNHAQDCEAVRLIK